MVAWNATKELCIIMQLPEDFFFFFVSQIEK
jgi:hypothetical protein